MRTPEYGPGDRLDLSFKTRISQNKARAEDGGRKRFGFVITNGSQDRHRTIIEPNGGDVNAFMNNPVVLFNHDYDKILGRAVNLELKGDSIIAQMEFDEDNEFALEKKGQVERGFLNATSIGFIIKSMDFDEDSDVMRITEWELVEFSIVSVPSNREALVISRDMREVAELKNEIIQLKDMVAEMRQPAVNSKQDARQAEEPEAIADLAAIEGETTEDAEAPQEATGEIPLEDAIHDEQEADPGEPAILETTKTAGRKARPEDYASLIPEMIRVAEDRLDRKLGRK